MFCEVCPCEPPSLPTPDLSLLCNNFDAEAYLMWLFLRKRNFILRSDRPKPCNRFSDAPCGPVPGFRSRPGSHHSLAPSHADSHETLESRMLIGSNRHTGPPYPFRS